METIVFDGEGDGGITVEIIIGDDKEEPFFDGFDLTGREYFGTGEMGPFFCKKFWHELDEVGDSAVLLAPLFSVD